jgi:amidase
MPAHNPLGVPATDPMGALVPHTLTAPLIGLDSGPLLGSTFMVKDLFAIAGQKVSNGNPVFFAHAEPSLETAPAIQRLLDCGATLTGITVCDEFFYSLLGTNAHYGTPRNVRAPGRVAGGSSCGSAAAVAAGMCDFALGTDTGGSIRVPASFCGLFGLRPSFGRIDTHVATPMAPSYDTVGFLARNGELFHKIGHALLDRDRVTAPVERLVVAEDMFARADLRIAAGLMTALGNFRDRLPTPEPMSIAGDRIDTWRNAFRIIQGSEIQSTLLPFVQSHDAKLGPDIQERFAMAAAIAPGELPAAKAARAEARARLHALATPGTVIALPTTPTLPPEIAPDGGEKQGEFRILTMQSTCLAGHAGLPQISIPACEAVGFPAGLSFIGWEGGDEVLLDLAVQLAQASSPSP